MVRILSGRFSAEPGFEIETLLNGFALYRLSDKLRAAFILAFAVVHFAPSIPAVRFPLFCVTFFTANSIA
jgi:hypothetical protein